MKIYCTIFVTGRRGGQIKYNNGASQPCGSDKDQAFAGGKSFSFLVKVKVINVPQGRPEVNKSRRPG
jgi:hypothetical protein